MAIFSRAATAEMLTCRSMEGQEATASHTVPMRILVVDDEPAIRQVVSELLQQLGHQVDTACDGREALALLEAHHHQLVLSDIQMPRMNGMQLLEHVSKHHPATRVLLITGYGTIDSAVSAMRMGALGYITKPVDFRALGREIEQFSQDLELQNSGGQLLREMLARFERGEPASRNPRMRNLMQLTITRIAETNSSVLITGESGTGKELMAALIHSFSLRRNGPFIKVNAAALPDSLLESELFGHVRGAFTGAMEDRQGRFTAAAGGTLFLDEIGETSLAMQGKLLRVIQEREFEALGSNQTQKADVRLICATNRDLSEARERGEFRQDLYYRINVLEIHLPPLRERMEDIPELTRYVVARLARKLDRPAPEVHESFVSRLMQHDWPGNIRELENVLERCMLLAGNTRELQQVHLPAELRNASGSILPVAKASGESADAVVAKGVTLEEAKDKFEYTLLKQVLVEEQGNVSACARRLGLARKNLQAKLKKYSIDAAEWRKP